MKKVVMSTVIMCLVLSFINIAQATKEEQLQFENEMNIVKNEVKQESLFEILSPQNGFTTTELDLSLSISVSSGNYIKVLIYKEDEKSPIIVKDKLEIKDIGICLEELDFQEAGKYKIKVQLYDNANKCIEVKSVQISIVNEDEAKAYINETIKVIDIKSGLRNISESTKEIMPSMIKIKEDLSEEKDNAIIKDFEKIKEVEIEEVEEIEEVKKLKEVKENKKIKEVKEVKENKKVEKSTESIIEKIRNKKTRKTKK